MCLKLCKAKRVKIKDGRTIIIRRPRMADAKHLLKYINSLVEEDALIQVNKKVDMREEREWLESKIKNIKKGKDHVLVGEVEGKIVSVMNLTKSYGRDSHVATLGISVMKNYRRLGIATFMMKRAIEIGKRDKSIKVITLEVLKPNKGAMRLYKKLGFRRVAALPNRSKYKKKYVDKIVMDLVK